WWRSPGASSRGSVTEECSAAAHVELLPLTLIEGDIGRRLLRDRRVTGAERPRPPHVLCAREDRVRPLWRVRITDLRPIESHRLAAQNDRRRRDHPLRRLPVAEIRVAEAGGEIV